MAADPNASEPGVPEGHGFHQLLSDLEQKCEAATDTWLSEAGENAPKCYESMGTALSLLDRLASCWWGCTGGDHTSEYLVARLYHNTRAGLVLLRRGFYDAALSMARAAGEVANLMWLCHKDANAIAKWTSLKGRDHWNTFRPKEVRRRLLELGLPAVIDDDRYGTLSQMGAHASSEHVPGRFDPVGRPKGPGMFQPIGALVALNENALAVSWGGCAAVGLIRPRQETRARITAACMAVMQSVGGVQAQRVTAIREQFRREADGRGDPTEA